MRRNIVFFGFLAFRGELFGDCFLFNLFFILLFGAVFIKKGTLSLCYIALAVVRCAANRAIDCIVAVEFLAAG